MPDPYIICCAAGVCCDDGSTNQQDALAQLYRDEMAKHNNVVSPEIAAAISRITLEHFKLKNREPFPPGVAPKERGRERKDGEARSREAEKEREPAKPPKKSPPLREGL